MAHFAQLDDNNKVLRVVVVDNKDTRDALGVEKEYIGIAHLERVLGGVWKQTSYNANFRKNYAGIGYTYDSTLDAFIPPKPYPSWILNNTICQWESPVPHPNDGKLYNWNESAQNWIEISNN